MGRQPGFVGWWRDHTYRRLSVERDVSQFVGWDILIAMINECDKTPYFKRSRFRHPYDADKLRRRDKALIATLFEAGGRVQEVLLLRKSNFEVTKDSLVVSDMKVLKRYKKVDEILDIKAEKPKGEIGKLYHWSHKHDAWVRRRYVTKPVLVTRGRFIIPKFEPLVKPILTWLDEIEDDNQLLFEGWGKLPHLTRERAYQIVRDIGRRVGLRICNHWFRAQRACQLATEYGFRDAELRRFFLWENDETVHKYAKLAIEDLEEKMQPYKIRVKGGLAV